MRNQAPGTLVKCRGREWVVLPSQDKDIVLSVYPRPYQLVPLLMVLKHETF